MRATIAYEPARHVWQAADRVDLAPAFRRAQRHSRRVRFLRIGIPLVIVGGILLNAIAGWIMSLSGINLPTIGSLAISGTKITMDQPRVAGYTRDGRAYELVARSAAQDLKAPQAIELSKVSAKMQLRDGTSVVITADTGNYDSKNEIVVLRENVLCVTSDGTEVQLMEATMDVRKGHVLSQKPVKVRQQNARIDAQQMEVVDNGAVVHFGGGVRLTTSGNGAMPDLKSRGARQ